MKTTSLLVQRCKTAFDLSPSEVNDLDHFLEDRLSLNTAMYRVQDRALSYRQVGYGLWAAWRLKRQEPLAYILKKAPFYGHVFRVNRHVLIPRPETEELTDWLVNEEASPHAPYRMLDMGTGSGNIAISCFLARSAWHVMGVDTSKKALKVARSNAKRLLQTRPMQGSHTPLGRLEWHVFDLMGTPFTWPYERVDMIVANLPYIALRDKSTLDRSVHAYEPHRALFSGVDGLDHYRRLSQVASRLLKSRGRIYLEMGRGQDQAIQRLFQREFHLQIKQDMQGVRRLLRAERKV